MCVCMCISMYVCVCVCMCMCKYVLTYVYMYVYVCVYVCVSITYVCMYIYVCMYVCIYVCIMYLYAYIQSNPVKMNSECNGTNLSLTVNHNITPLVIATLVYKPIHNVIIELDCVYISSVIYFPVKRLKITWKHVYIMM